jgi:hypothetical protein
MSLQQLRAVAIALLCALLISATQANTEKAIFLAPAISDLKTLNLSLDTLTPSAPKLRKSLPVAFPTSDQPYGSEYWFLLRDLNPGQRYEVRVCWAAIQPTSFLLTAFDINDILASPESFPQASNSNSQLPLHTSKHQESVVVLLIHAAADFFTTDKARMQSPPPVHADIILDPYLANIFPKSLLPTGVYIVCLAIGSFFVSGYIWKGLWAFVSSDTKKEHTQ